MTYFFVALTWPVLCCAAGAAVIAFLMVYITNGEGRRPISAVQACLIATLIGGFAATAIFIGPVALFFFFGAVDNGVSMQTVINFALAFVVAPAVVIGTGGLLGAGMGVGLRRYISSSTRRRVAGR